MKTFQIYYGPVTTEISLWGYDMVIVEPRHVNVEQVRAWKAAGTVVIGYLSVLETPTWNEARYVKTRGLRSYRHFPEWDSYLMDIRDLTYQGILLQEVLDVILVKEMDGVFLDTVGDMEEYVAETRLREEMFAAYRDFLQRLKVLAPEAMLIQNRGFDTLPLVKSWLDGVLWEDWRGELYQDAWVQERLRLLRDVRVFTVSASSDPVHEKTSRKLGFTHLTRDTDYLKNPV
ncbi:endo alpha-1,4 polygalactosaminidase [Tumebacillus sp. ITR2]|uniref:Endo alpha-1,4 polygalactosaminidase n=1 Tax=Tumebacillus amylolyticus TaxID=2801339 RepID=A0ABS1JFM5_9BACL|nr:endo alpha-1,4 polygalactosaminidase [Tumebacillus amylolyticus]MBL0389025.1 endo alpha-1,4 polygalactosaminidase [Tumebacillus amylolyticus]